MFTLFMLKIVMAFVAIVLLSIGMFCVLRVFDRLLGIDFKQAFNKIEECPKAMAHYYGLRNLGTTLAIGLIVCVCFIL